MATATAIDYHDEETLCKGVYYRPDDSAGPLPVVLIVHAWDGLVQEVHEKAQRLAEEGYIAFGVDVFGNGTMLTDMAQLGPTIEPLMTDRRVLLRRLQAAVDAVQSIDNADTHRVAVMGYCFGGLCALDLARGGSAQIKAAVSFHGALLPSGIASQGEISAKILVLHGQADPLVPPEQVAAFMTEMTDKNADWQLHAYGNNTVHAFTRAEANDAEFGTVYDEVADRRSWQSMLNILQEVFG